MNPESPLVLAAEFPPVTAGEWRRAVDRTLSGRDRDLTTEELARRFERQLITTTYDGIAVQPLYARADVPPAAADIGVPGFWPYVRGATVLGAARAGWDVRQSIDLDQVTTSGSKRALDHLERGATSLFLRPDALGPAEAEVIDVDLLDAALDGVYLDLVTIAVDSPLGVGGAQALIDLWRRRNVDPASAAGVLGLDPIGVAASSGRCVEQADIDAAAAIAVSCAEHWPQVRAWVADATRYHEAGSSDAEELAFATATGVAYLRLLTEAGMDAEQAFAQIEFRLAATADQFATLAKLRASRRMWARVAEVVGTPEVGAQHQHALTSRAMLTRYDPWVNLLRNTTACFAAGAGGAEAITVEAHDVLVEPGGGSELGRRMARNTQLLLLEETQLGRVLDPGGGSWYLEWLTHAMAQRAWALFCEIEAAGGMTEALNARLVQDRIETTWAARSERLARRTETIVGVSDYPQLVGGAPSFAPASTSLRTRATPMGGLPRRRYGEVFEELRRRTDDRERSSGVRPCVLLVRLGAPSAYTARGTYAKSFFETAGFLTAAYDVGQPLDHVALQAAIDQNGAVEACLCSSDPVYAEQGSQTLEALAVSGLARVYAATRHGRPGDDLLAAGADELIYAGCDVLDALQRALDAAGVP